MAFVPNPKFSEIKTTTEPNRSGIKGREAKQISAPKTKGKGGFRPPPAKPAAKGGFKPPEGQQTAQLSNPAQTVPPAVGLPPAVGEGESKPGYDRSSHFKGNPGFAEGRQEPGQSYADEQTEHWGDKSDPGPKGKAMPHATAAPTHSIGVPALGSSQAQGFGTPHTFRNVRTATPYKPSTGGHRIGKR